MPRHVLTCLVASACLACGSSDNRAVRPPATAATEPARTPAQTNTPAADTPAAYTAAEPSPVAIVIVNDTDRPVTFDRSLGPAQPLGLARLDGPLDPYATLDDRDDALSHGWIGRCACYCGTGECRECTPPLAVEVTLAPGERYTLPWTGRFRRRAAGGCLEAYTPPAGRYVFTACDVESACSQRMVSLPSAAPIEIPLSAHENTTSCEDLDASTMARVGGLAKNAVLGVLRDRPVAACPERPTCVEPNDLERLSARTSPGQCALLAIPRGAEVEYRVYLPLPASTLGGENFSQFYDPAGTRPLHTRFEQ